jgi:hypothetical protein
MYDILSKGRVHNLSVCCHLDLFDKIITPMLTYGSEILILIAFRQLISTRMTKFST